MLGEKIRRIRKSKALTLKDLAEATGFSVGFLSQVERSASEPSLSALRKISDALGVSPYALLEQETLNPMLVKAERRALVKLPNSTIQYEVVSPLASGNYLPSSLIVQFEINPGGCDAEDGFLSHTSEEIVLVLEGAVNMTVDGMSYQLNAGDSLLVKPNTPHRTENPNEATARGLCILTPMSWPN